MAFINEKKCYNEELKDLLQPDGRLVPNTFMPRMIPETPGPCVLQRQKQKEHLYKARKRSRLSFFNLLNDDVG